MALLQFEKTSDRSQLTASRWGQWWGNAARARNSLILISLSLTVLACYWTTLVTVASRWHEAQYSHGFLVPIFAAYLLWHRAGMLRKAELRPSGWGVAFLAIGFLMRVASALLAIESLDAYSLLPLLAGLALLLGGWSYLRWCWPAIAFLAFMIPLPYQAEIALARPLRRLATLITTYLLQTLGYPALAEGNVILIDQLRLGVVDACSGLGMLMTFFTLATAMALVAQVTLFDRLVIVASAIPIAVLANVVRITATAVAYQTFGAPVAHVLMHDLAGWLMMPLALAALLLELWFLRHLLIRETPVQRLPLGLPGMSGTAPTKEH